MPTGYILVVDDERSIRTFSRRILEHAGYRVTEADCAQAAIEALIHGTFDAILTDLRMPFGSGESLIEWILLYRPSVSERILVVTGEPRPEALLTFLTRIEIPVLGKPYTRAELLAAVDKIIQPTKPSESELRVASTA